MPQDDRLKGKATPKNVQAHALAKLLKDPSKPVVIPEMGADKKTLRPAREMIANVQGSTAAAGSGEFHVYKEARRREYERLAILDEEDKKVKGPSPPCFGVESCRFAHCTAQAREEAEAVRRQKEYEAAAEAKTAKNRAKRQKRKMAGKKGKATKQDEDDNSGSGDDSKPDQAAIKKRKIGASGALPSSVTPATEQDDAQETLAEQQRIAQEAGITIQDDD